MLNLSTCTASLAGISRVVAARGCALHPHHGDDEECAGVAGAGFKLLHFWEIAHY